MTETLRRVQLVSVPTLTEPKRNPKDKPDGSSQPKTKTPEKTPPTKRFSLKLNSDDSDCCMEYSFNELMEAYNKDDDMIDPLNDNDEANLRALERKFQEKYGPKRRRYGNAEDYIDKGLGYDETDPFIDNEEAYDELVPSTLTTKHGGFYINSGELEFRPLLPEEINDDDEDDIRPHVSKRKRKEIGKEPGNKLKDKKKKLNLANTSSSKKTVAQMLNQRKLSQKNGLDDDEVDEDDEIEQIDIENNKHNNGKEAVVSATVCDVIESVAKGEVQPNGIECLSSAKPPANSSIPSQPGKSVQLQPGKSVQSQPGKSVPSQQPVKSVQSQQPVKSVPSQLPLKSVPSQLPLKSIPSQQSVKSKEKQKSEEAFMSHALNKIIEQSLGDFPNSGQISASSQNRIKTTQSSSSSLLPSTPMKIEDMIVRNLSKNTKENAHNKQPEIIIDIASSPEMPRQQQPKQPSQSQKNLNQVQVIKQPQSQSSHSQAQQQAQQQAMQKQRKIKQLAQAVLQQQTVQQKPNHNIYNRPTLADQIKKKSSSQSSSMLQSSQQQREQLIQQQLQREKSQQQQRELQMQREKSQQRELQREKQCSSSKASNHTSISITAIPNANAVSSESVSSSNRQTNQNSSSQRYSSSAVTSSITPTSSALDLSPQSIQAIQLGMLQGTNFNALQNQSANPISAHSLTIPSHNYLSHLFSSTSNRNLIPSRSSLPSISQLENSPLGFNPIYLHQFATTHPTDGRGRNSN